MSVTRQVYNVPQEHFLFFVLWGVFMSAILSVLAIFMLTATIFFSDVAVDSKKIHLCLVSAMFLSIFAASLYSARKTGSRGWLTGLLIGGVYALLLLQLAGWLGQGADGGMLLQSGKLLICMLTGALGGILGVNL